MLFCVGCGEMNEGNWESSTEACDSCFDGWMDNLDHSAESFSAEECVSCDTPDGYWRGLPLCASSGEELCISCCACNMCRSKWNMLEVGEQKAESFAAEGDDDLDIHSGSYHGIKHRSYEGVRYKGNLLKCKCGSEKEFHYPYGCYSCGPQAHRGKGRIAGFTPNGRIVWKDECTGRFMVDFRNPHGGKTDIRLLREGSSCSCKEAESFGAESINSFSPARLVVLGASIGVALGLYNTRRD